MKGMMCCLVLEKLLAGEIYGKGLVRPPRCPSPLSKEATMDGGPGTFRRL